jgi:hypothetical protein
VRWHEPDDARVSSPESVILQINVLQSRAAPRLRILARMLNPPQKTRIVFHMVLEPVFLRLGANQGPRGLPWRVMTISCVSASQR